MTPVVPLNALADGEMLACQVENVDVLLCRVDGRCYALANRCSHAQQNLHTGRLRGHEIAINRLDVLRYPTVRQGPVLPGDFEQEGSNCRLSAKSGLSSVGLPAGSTGALTRFQNLSRSASVRRKV